MKKILFLLVFLVMFSVLVSAGATLNQNYDLKIPCDLYNCSNLNVTIAFPNSSLFIDNKIMTDNSYYANYTIKPPINGRYNYYYYDGGEVGDDYFITTSTGNELSTNQVLLYFFIGLFLTGLLILCIYGGSSLPFENTRSVSENEVIKVNWKKYLKIFCWTSAYMVLMALVFVAWNLTWAYSDWFAFSNFLHYIFRLLYLFFLPVLIGVIIMALINYVTDVKINKFIKKTGLPYREV